MKHKRLFYAIPLVLLMAFGLSNQQPKTFTITLTEPQLNSLWQVIDQSNSPHTQVTEIQNIIRTQYQQQLKDTTSKK